ncbi:MAG: quinate 5-dehydrogenase [Syntrophothermus sp.]
MKRVVSVSIGSSTRDKAVEVDILGEKFRIERIGTDGDMQKAVDLLHELDGKVAAFGMGGIDLYLWAGKRRYLLRDARKLAAAPRLTPIVDGSGLKNTLERRVVEYLRDEAKMPLAGMKVLLVSGMDRFGMAEALQESGCEVILGDFMFALGLPIPLRSLKALHRAARVIAPIACQLPFSMLYPTGEKQKENKPRYERYYQWAEMIAGDWHFIKKYMPERLDGKIILTNTITEEDVKELRKRGAAKLITTTPELDGRSFGTNVMEGVLIALSGKPAKDMQPADYLSLLDKISFKPRIENLA